MSERGGWVKVARKLLDWRWYKDANTARVFLHLLLSANVIDHDFQHVTIHRGQVATSYESIANALGLSVQNVRTAIGHLKSTGELTSKAYSKFQVLTIVSWDLYQCELTGKLTGNQQATNNNQRSKEAKNILSSELSQSSSTDKPKVKKVFNHDEAPYKAARWLADEIERRLSTCKPYTENHIQAWALDFDRCNRLDGHPWEEINDVLAFSQNDGFWNRNILSGSKFRKQYIALLAQMGGQT